MINDDNIFVGLSGIYCYKNDYDNAWLGFFGIIDLLIYLNKLLNSSIKNYCVFL